MSSDWYLMGNPQIYNGGFEGAEFYSYARSGFQELLDTSMLCDRVEFITSDFSEVVKGQAIVQSVTPDSQIKAEDRQILVPIGTLGKFSYVRFKGDIWILASEPSDNKFYEKAVLKVCKNTLKWQDPITKKILNYWYWCEDITRYSSGVYQGNVIVKYDKQYHLLLPMDYNTRNLHDGMRFMLEMSGNTPLVFKLTKFDGMTGNNQNIKLLNLSLTQTVYDKDRDNVDLMVADYNETKAVSNLLNCKIDYRSDCISLCSFGEFSAVFRDNIGEINQNIDFGWEISDNEFDIDNLIISYDENKVKIIVKNNKELVGKDFILSVVASDEVLASIKVKIIALW